MNAEGILRAAAPPGFTIQHIAAVEPRLPALQTQVQVAEYMLTLLDVPGIPLEAARVHRTGLMLNLSDN